MLFPDLRKVDPLFERMPSRARAAFEVTFVIAFGLGCSLSTNLALMAALIVSGVVLVRPWAAVHGSRGRRVVTAILLVPALLFTTVLPRASELGGRRIGINLEAASLLPGDPVKEGPVAKITAVAPGSPAAGRLRVGDRLVSIAGRPLAAANPAADLRERLGTDDVPVDTSAEVLRDGALVTVPLHVPWPAWRAGASAVYAFRRFVPAHPFAFLVMIDLCLIALVILLARADGQRIRQLGLVRAGAVREIALGLPVLAIPFGAFLLVHGDPRKRPTGTQNEVFEMFAAQGTGVSVLLSFAVTMVFAAAFEELVFRGFLVPRLKRVTGSWALAIVLAALAFGLGHLYEGVAGVVETFVIGVYFALVLLWRGRLESAIVAHALINIALFTVFQRR